VAYNSCRELYGQMGGVVKTFRDELPAQPRQGIVSSRESLMASRELVVLAL
jgi:hypothetical protein